MNGPTENTEQRVEGYFAHQRERIHAPPALASRVDAALNESPRAAVRRRWPAIALTVGAAAAIAAVLLYVLSDFAGPGHRSAEDVLANARSALVDPASVGLNSYRGTLLLHGASEMRVWFEARDRYRLEYNVTEESPPHVQIETADDFWEYDTGSNTYRIGEEGECICLQFQFGPHWTDAPELDEGLGGGDGSAGANARLLREDVALGRPVYIIEYRPARVVTNPGSLQAILIHSWIDKEFFFTLKEEITLEDGSRYDSEFVEIFFNEEIDDTLFAPPDGAVPDADLPGPTIR